MARGRDRIDGLIGGVQRRFSRDACGIKIEGEKHFRTSQLMSQSHQSIFNHDRGNLNAKYQRRAINMGEVMADLLTAALYT